MLGSNFLRKKDYTWEKCKVCNSNAFEEKKNVCICSKHEKDTIVRILLLYVFSCDKKVPWLNKYYHFPLFFFHFQNALNAQRVNSLIKTAETMGILDTSTESAKQSDIDEILGFLAALEKVRSIHSFSTVWKIEKFTLTWKIFREIRSII